MSETPYSPPEGPPIPDQQTPFGDQAPSEQPPHEGQHEIAEGNFGGYEANPADQVADQVPDQAPGEVSGQVPEETTQAPHASWETADQKRAMYAVWLKGRGIDPATAPHISMKPREFELFRIASPEKARAIYEDDIPQGDQIGDQYAVIEIEPKTPDQPHDPRLVVINEVDFGTTVDDSRVASDFNPDPIGPSSPMPESPTGAVKTVDIQEALAESHQNLETLLTKSVMKGVTEDPFSTEHGDVAVRAGDLMSGQTDAYVWTVTPFTKSVELTLNLPSTYDSVCVVRGQQQEAANGKNAMAQMINPEVVLKIEGEDLARLQDVYRSLYRQPDYALTDQQRRERDELYNGYVKRLISDQARFNKEQEQNRKNDEARRYRRAQQPKLRERELPYS